MARTQQVLANALTDHVITSMVTVLQANTLRTQHTTQHRPHKQRPMHPQAGFGLLFLCAQRKELFIVHTALAQRTKCAQVQRREIEQLAQSQPMRCPGSPISHGKLIRTAN